MSTGFIALGAAAAVGIFKATEAFVHLGSETLQLQRVTGQTAEEASKLLFVGHELGIGVDQLSVGFGLLSKNIVNGALPLFTYFDRFGNPINPAAAGQTTVPFLDTGTIRVTLSAQFQSGSPLLSYTSDLALRNNR